MERKLPDINLLPQHEQQSSTFYYICILLFILLIVAFGWMGLQYFSTKGALKTAQETSNHLDEEIQIVQTKINSMQTEGSSNLTDMVAFLEDNEWITSPFIKEINALRPEHSYLSSYTFSAKKAKVVAHFETLDDVASYTSKLNHSEFAKDVKINQVDTFTSENDEEEIFDTIPRYETTFTLTLDKKELKGAAEDDE